MRSFAVLSCPFLKPAAVAALLSALAACTSPPRLAPPDAPSGDGPAPRQGVMIIDAPPPPPAAVTGAPPSPDLGPSPGLRQGPQDPGPPVVSARPKVQPPPEYPAALRDQGIEGRVVASIQVSASGQVDVVTIRSATDPLFEQAVRTALKRWRFEPARSRSGQAVSSRVQIPFRFRVE